MEEDIPKALQIKIKRSFVRMEVIKKESEKNLKYIDIDRIKLFLFHNFVLTVTVEHPGKENNVIGREIFTCDKVTFDSLLEKVNETGNRIWNKYVEWQPYAYAAERG